MSMILVEPQRPVQQYTQVGFLLLSQPSNRPMYQLLPQAELRVPNRPINHPNALVVHRRQYQAGSLQNNLHHVPLVPHRVVHRRSRRVHHPDFRQARQLHDLLLRPQCFPAEFLRKNLHHFLQARHPISPLLYQVVLLRCSLQVNPSAFQVRYQARFLPYHRQPNRLCIPRGGRVAHYRGHRRNLLQGHRLPSQVTNQRNSPLRYLLGLHLTKQPLNLLGFPLRIRLIVLQRHRRLNPPEHRMHTPAPCHRHIPPEYQQLLRLGFPRPCHQLYPPDCRHSNQLWNRRGVQQVTLLRVRRVDLH